MKFLRLRMSTLHFHLLSPGGPGFGVWLLACTIIIVAKSCSVKKNTNTSAPKLSGKPSMPGESITVKETAIRWRTEKIQNLNFLWRDLRSIVQSWNRRLCFAIIFISHSPLFIKQFSCSDTDSSLFRHHPLTLGLRSFFHWVCRIVDMGIGERFRLKMVVNAGSWQLEDQNRVYGLKSVPSW